MKTLILPLPDNGLSPNARLHWSKVAKLKKRARNIASVYASHQWFFKFKAESYKLVFYWPDKRRRDKDNAAARCKAYLDGIADFLEQDDSEWDFDGVAFEIDREKPRLEIQLKIK